MEESKMEHKFENDLELESAIEELDRAELRPVLVDGNEVEYQKAVWNTTKSRCESIVKSTHGLIEHRQAFLPFVSALREKGITLKGVVKNDGGIAEIEALFDNYGIQPKDGEVIAVGVRLQNSYNKRGFVGQSFGKRLVCSNGMISTVETASMKVVHTDLATLDQTFQHFISSVVKGVETLEEKINKAIEEELELAEARGILHLYFGKKMTAELMRIFQKNLGNKNKWQLYNAITNYASHQGKDEKQYEKLLKIADRLLVAPLSDLRNQVRLEARAIAE